MIDWLKRNANPPRRQPQFNQSESGGSRRHKPDYWLLILAALLVVCGLVTVYSISPGLAASEGVSESYFVTKQLLAVFLGLCALVAASLTPLKWWEKTSKTLLLTAIVASIVVMMMPVDFHYQAHRWIQLGNFSFQVAELIKLSVLVWTARFLAQQASRGQLSNIQTTLKPLLYMILTIGIVVGKMQSDFGSTTVMIAMIGSMAFVVGVPIKRILPIVLVIGAGAVLLIAGSSYRRDRVFTFLNPEKDCQNSGYQACEALIAIGTGGVVGQGLGHGVQAYGYLPEAANDSIFAIMAEKFGFIGMTLVISIYGALFFRLKRIIVYTADQFTRLLVVGILAWISTQMMINAGAMMGLLPIKGITLPFISYGGTSLLFLTAALGLVFRISRYTSYSIQEPPIINETQTNNNSTNGGRIRGPYHAAPTHRPRT